MLNRTLLIVVTSLLHAGVPYAQAPAPGQATEKPRRTWRISPEFRGQAEYDHNIFLLPGGRRTAPNSPSAEERSSGRYASMASGYDLVGSVDGSVRLRRRGLGGRPLELRPAVGADVHALNTARNNAWLGMAVEQELRRGRRLQLATRYAPEHFRRNYLSGATDEDADGLISPGERRYSAGRASEISIDANYRHRLRRAGGGSFAAWGELGAGYESHSYAAPFQGRSLAGPNGGVRLLTDVGRLRLDVGYQGAWLAATPLQEVLLVRDGVARRAVTGVPDRSRTEHGLRVASRAELTRRSHLSVELERRTRTFTSTEPSDVAYRGRRNARESVAVEVGRRRGDLRSFALVRYARQLLRRGSGSGSAEDEDDYTRLQAAAGLRVTF